MPGTGWIRQPLKKYFYSEKFKRSAKGQEIVEGDTMKHWMFRCNDVSQKVSKSMDTALPVHQYIAVWLHLMMCRYCYRFKKQLMMLRNMSHKVDSYPAHVQPKETLSLETKERIKKRLNAYS